MIGIIVVGIIMEVGIIIALCLHMLHQLRQIAGNVRGIRETICDEKIEELMRKVKEKVKEMKESPQLFRGDSK